MDELHKDEADDCYNYMLDNNSKSQAIWLYSSKCMMHYLHESGEHLLTTLYFGYVMNKWYNKANPFKVGE